jgi:hypothetical protein
MHVDTSRLYFFDLESEAAIGYDTTNGQPQEVSR